MLLQTPRVLESASPLLILYKAITQRLSVICCVLKGAQYDFGRQKALLGSLAQSLSVAQFELLRRVLLEIDVTLPRLQGVLQRTIPSIISLSYDVHASEVKGKAFIETLTERLHHDVVQQGHYGLAMFHGHMHELQLLRRSVTNLLSATRDHEFSQERSAAIAEAPIGTRVRHRTRGTGVIAEKMEDGRLRILFDEGGAHRYKPSSFPKIRLLGGKTGARGEMSGGTKAKVLNFRRRASLPPPGSHGAEQAEVRPEQSMPSTRAELSAVAVDSSTSAAKRVQLAVNVDSDAFRGTQGQGSLFCEEQQHLEQSSLGSMTTSEAV